MIEYRFKIFLSVFLWLVALPLCSSENTGLIHGVIRDSVRGEALSDVNIIVKGTSLGAVTGKNGHFVIRNLAEGTYRVVASMVGYKSVEKEVTVQNNKTATCDISLESNVIQMHSVVSRAEGLKSGREAMGSSKSLNTRELRMAPCLAEADVFRSLQMLPGVIAQNEFFSQLYVRGSSPDQNLILLDGVTVYNPYHLGGVFSTFDVNVVQEAELLSGGFPAQYGGRLAAVLNVINKTGTSQEVRGNAEVNVLSSKLSLEGPCPAGSWMFSARRTHFDKLLRALSRDFPYYFYDFQGKFISSFSPKSKVTVSGLYGTDVLDYIHDTWKMDIDDLYVSWGNKTIGLKWEYIIHPRLFSSLQLSWTSFFGNVDMNDDEHIILKNRISDTSLQGDWTYQASRNHTVQFGTLFKSFAFKYMTVVDNTVRVDEKTKPTEVDMYFQDVWNLSADLTVQSGLRLSHFGPWYTWRGAPRLGITYRLGKDTAVKGSCGFFYQYLKTVNDEELYFPLKQKYSEQDPFLRQEELAPLKKQALLAIFLRIPLSLL